LRDLTAIVQRLAYAVQGNHDNEQHEREKLLLRLELLLRSENRLPPANPLSESEKDVEIEALKQIIEELKERLTALETGLEE